MVNLNAGIIAGIRMPVPGIERQTEILSGLNAQHDEIVSLMNQAKKLHLIKQGLADDLLTGRVRVTDGGVDRVGAE
jgi:hypothetical protein